MMLVWTERALARLGEIEDFIAHDDLLGAIRFVDALVDRCDALQEFPESGRVVPEIGATDVRELLEGNYRIVYRVRPDRVEILTVFEGHRLFPVDDVPAP